MSADKPHKTAGHAETDDDVALLQPVEKPMRNLRPNTTSWTILYPFTRSILAVITRKKSCPTQKPPLRKPLQKVSRQKLLKTGKEGKPPEGVLDPLRLTEMTEDRLAPALYRTCTAA